MKKSEVTTEQFALWSFESDLKNGNFGQRNRNLSQERMEIMRKERMNGYFSVFNNHINNAKERANREFIAQFGQEKFDAWIKPCEDNGIMSIFDMTPNIYTMSWVVLVTAFVNENHNSDLGA